MEAAEIVRLNCDACNKGEITEICSGKRPIFWRGSDVAFQLALTQNGKHVLASDMGKVVVELKDRYACPQDPSLWRAEIQSGESGHTAKSWSAGTTQLVTAYLPKEISERLIQGHYWLIVRHEKGVCATHLSHRIEVREDHSSSTQVYNFAAGGTTSTSTGTPVTTRISTPIPANATEVTVNVPAGFTPANYTNHYVTGPAGEVNLSDTIQLGSGDLKFFLNASPSNNGTHQLVVDFLKLT